MSDRPKFIWEYRGADWVPLLRGAAVGLSVGVAIAMVVVRYTVGRHDTDPEFVINDWPLYLVVLGVFILVIVCLRVSRRLDR